MRSGSEEPPLGVDESSSRTRTGEGEDLINAEDEIGNSVLPETNADSPLLPMSPNSQRADTETSHLNDSNEESDNSISVRKISGNRKSQPHVIESDDDSVRLPSIQDIPNSPPETSFKLACINSAISNLIDSDDESDGLPSIQDDQHSNAPAQSSTIEPENGVSHLVDTGDDSEDLPSIHEDYGLSSGKKSDTNVTGKSADRKIRKLTKKQRDELAKETLSKTQRMIREKPVSLPYEKPKSMSLKEFLEKRARSRAEFYNPELKKLRQPDISSDQPLSNFDLTHLEQQVVSKKVEDWVTNARENFQSTDPDDVAVDEAFKSLDDLEDLSLVDGDKSEQTVPIHEPSSIGMDTFDVQENYKAMNSESANSILPEVASKTDAETLSPSLQEASVSIGTQERNLDERISQVPFDNISRHSKENLQEVSDGEAKCEDLDKAEAAEKDFQAKEAALEAYLEANKPKPHRKSIKELLKMNPEFAKVANIKPAIQPIEKGYIEFSLSKPQSVPTNPGVENLKMRFMKHITPPKKPAEQHFTVVVTNKEEDSQGNLPTIDKIDYVQHIVDEPGLDSPHQTPGAKLNQLRQTLQSKIRAKKAEQFEEKRKIYSMYENELDVNEKEPLDAADELLDDDFTTESEPEETDEEAEAVMAKRRKKKPKSAFVDEEAEVDSEDPYADEEEDETDSEHGNEDAKEESEDQRENDDDGINEKFKSYRRVRAVIEDSSDDEEVETITLDEEPLQASNADLPTPCIPKSVIPKKDPDSKSLEGVEKFSSETGLNERDEESMGSSQLLEQEDEDKITPAQREVRKLIDDPIVLDSCSREDFSSGDPLSLHITNDSSVPSPFPRFDSEAALDAFRQDIPRKPCVQQELSKEIAKLVGESVEKSPSELSMLCSGVFPSQNPLTPQESQSPETKFTSPVADFGVNNFDISPQKEQATPRIERDKLKKTRLLFSETEEIQSPPTISLDDEDERGGSVVGLKKRKRRLQFSDDEDEQEVEKFESDRNSEEGSVYDSSDIERGYDSEENEILIPKNSNRNVKGLVSKTGKIRHEFVEAEAELSGSEEGSGDEDEKDLDEMDEEDGDAEDIDEEDLREGIVRHHVLKMNDADARDVRILQDGLLENGDLHGDGIMRERQFKWKHIDALEIDGDEAEAGDGDGVILEDEDEAERLWKEQKAEKARWMKENSQSMTQTEDVESEEEDPKLCLEKSKHFKLGKSVLGKIQSSCSLLESSFSNVYSEVFSEDMGGTRKLSKKCIHSMALLASPDDPILKMKRGSFLARESSSLSKIAEMTKGADTINSVKVNSRNFVFSVITPPGPEPEKGKRKHSTCHPSNREEQPRKTAKVERSFKKLDPAKRAASIFSQY